ncbi:ras and Rab interactor 2 isoform X1 [Phycodurus eques]|uniref:ras and Rab interactor 2 isoform X1 n=2 Tax=Phycodurus eques TaxID=693459 RepID=UPI002ACD459F|nr:ras and Rab interactor 2 isoform X1 [Phycodurus eques]
MSTHNIHQSYKRERKSSFLKLIESFALEIGTLKKEMWKKPETTEEQKTDSMHGLGEEVGGLFLQATPCADMGTGLAGVRDSGYDSLHRRLSVLDRLISTHSVWLQLDLSHQNAIKILQNQTTGTFVVRKSSSLQKKVISLRMDKNSPVPVKDFVVKESQYTFSLEASGLSFADLFRLVAFCCISRDVLPFTLKLPEAIASAKTSAELVEVAKLGAGFWDTQLCHKRNGSAFLLGPTAPDRPPPPGQLPLSVAPTPGRPRLLTRTPSELECCQSNGALCFINPLFIKVHQLDRNHSPKSNYSGLNNKPLNHSTETNTPHFSGDQPEGCNSHISDSKLSNENKSHSLGINTDLQTQKKQSGEDSPSRSPPTRPPPPRFATQQSGLPVRQQSMPEKISWINVPKEKGEEKERSSSLLSRLGSSLSISPSSSPPKRLSISSPISIPRPSLPISLSSLSSSPRRAKSSPSSSLEDVQCHLALEDKTIEKALLKAKLSQQNGGKACIQPCSSLPDSSLMTISKQAVRGGGGEEAGEEGKEVSQRLSDMSISTDSSDSLDFSQSSPFFLPPLHDPSPPTVADFNAHLPLSLPSSHLLYCSMEEDDDEEEDEDEEEPDYGVGLESDQDQDQDLTMIPPGHRIRRRSSASALVLQKALRGHLRKMSGVFNSLLTPEKRAIRRVVELSRDKGSYFGSLVQDYLSYMGEGAGTPTWQSFASGLELLQTLRQFITQMKSYLRQSSELGLPIESLIPEDQIDHVLEKAMHKCVLKPLKPMVSAALQEFQVRSGEWQELRENMSLAKARQPQDMGVDDMVPPDPIGIEKIKYKFHTMCKLYSPEKKVTMLLRVCKLIYTIMEDNSGRLYGADDFLPMLTYVLAQCDIPQLDNEILYMMELLDPSLLHGEGGYYLTSAYGAMSLIRNFQEEQAARVLSSETRNTLHQWHHRRTTLHSAPSFDDFQNYLRVALQGLGSGCTAKTLPVRPFATVEEVCQLCALKFKVSNPDSYGLFLLTEGSSQQLAPDTHPQKIKAELHSRPQAPPFYFVYRRLANRSTSPSTPLESSPSPDNHTLTSEHQANLNDLNPESPAPSLDSELKTVTLMETPYQEDCNWTASLTDMLH